MSTLSAFLLFAAIPLTAVAYIWGFWALYVLIMGLYRAHLAGKLNTFNYVMGSPFLVLGYLVDLVAQYTLAILIFWDFPASWLKERLVTTRLQRYIAQGPAAGWRYKLAALVCDKVLDPFDPTGNHC